MRFNNTSGQIVRARHQWNVPPRVHADNVAEITIPPSKWLTATTVNLVWGWCSIPSAKDVFPIYLETP
jgi:hypothetical protein